MSRKVRDINHTVTGALPNGADSSYSAVLDTGERHASAPAGELPEGIEMEIVAPALVVGDLGNGATMKYSVCAGSTTTPTTILAENVIVQTGASSAGAASQTVRFRLPSDVARYVRVKATNSAAGDASDKSMTVSLLF